MSNSRPAGLGYQGKKLWDSIAAPGKYVLRPDELFTLEDACRISDMIDTLTKDWVDLKRPTTAEGSMGQLIIHPLVDKLADHRMKRSTLLAKLKLPDELAAGAAERGVQQRDAAQSRWGSTHGAGG